MDVRPPDLSDAELDGHGPFMPMRGKSFAMNHTTPRPVMNGIVTVVGNLVTFVRRFAVELLIAAPFVGLVIASAVILWGNQYFWLPILAFELAVLPLSYLLLLLMMHQHRERPKSTIDLSKVRDDEL